MKAVKHFITFEIVQFAAVLLGILLVPALLHGRPRGGMSDGGGCVFVREDQPSELTDFFYVGLFPNAKLEGDEIKVSSRMRRKTLAAIKRTDIEKIDISALRSYQLALEKISTWNQDQSIWGSHLFSAIEGLRRVSILELPYYLKMQNKNLCMPIPAGLPADQIQPVVVFDESLGIILSVPRFNEMNLYAQAGLWIHEAIRLMQILSQEPVPPEFVPQITTMILFENPDKISLDEKFKLPGSLGESLRSRQVLRRRAAEVCGYFAGLKRIPQLSQLDSYSDLYQRLCPPQAGFTQDELSNLDSFLQSRTLELDRQAFNRKIRLPEADQKKIKGIGLNQQELQQRDALREVQSEIRDYIRERAFSVLHDLDNSPQVSSLIFAAQRLGIKGEISFETVQRRLQEIENRAGYAAHPRNIFSESP